MLQFYKQWYMLPWGFILSEKQKRNTLIPLCERFIKYLYYRSQNKIRNTSTDCLLRKNQHLSWYYFQFMLLNPICFWLFCLFGFFLICAGMLSFAIFQIVKLQNHPSSLNLFSSKIFVLKHWFWNLAFYM